MPPVLLLVTAMYQGPHLTAALTYPGVRLRNKRLLPGERWASGNVWSRGKEKGGDEKRDVVALGGRGGMQRSRHQPATPPDQCHLQIASAPCGSA